MDCDFVADECAENDAHLVLQIVIDERGNCGKYGKEYQLQRWQGRRQGKR